MAVTEQEIRDADARSDARQAALDALAAENGILRGDGPDDGREATPEESALWQARYGSGYSRGRTDGQWGDVDGCLLIDVPGEIPGECGSRYVARHLGIAYQIGYTRGVQYGRAHPF
jgi:hypothetical protein